MRAPFFFLVFITLCFLGFGYMHEQVHVIIYNSYGIESHVEYLSHFPDFVTIAEEPCPTESCRLAHHINEAISYPLLMFFLMIAGGFFVIVCYKDAMFELEKYKLEMKNEKIR